MEKYLLNDPERLALVRKLHLKYLFSQITGCLVLLGVWPLYLLIALVIAWDGLIHRSHRGPVFYTEPRISAGRVFRIVKFRTVTLEAVRWIQERPEERSITSNGTTTCAGRFILRHYLDEFPQLINIAKGDMTFVGLRPHIIAHTRQEAEQGFPYRYWIKAGLFGIPQACKRDPKYQAIIERMARMHKPSQEVLQSLDGLYIRKCKEKSPVQILLMDLSLAGRCLYVVFRGGATA